MGMNCVDVVIGHFGLFQQICAVVLYQTQSMLAYCLYKNAVETSVAGKKKRKGATIKTYL